MKPTRAQRSRSEPLADPVGIGDGSIIRKTILDKNARVGRGVKIENRAGARHLDGDNYFIREGIVIVPKNAVIPDGTVI